ncbi:MAG: hypothetical protein ACE15C_12390 [Phycisphaerae bacterium]
MKVTRLLGLIVCAAILLPAVTAQAFHVSPQAAVQGGQEQARSVSQAISDLEREVTALESEFAKSPANVPTTQPAAQTTTQTQPQIDVTDFRNQPISMQYRIIHAVVHFNRLRVVYDEGPEMCFSQGDFVDPSDGKTYHFQFNDMGAMASTREDKQECIVVFRPADRQLTESDIAAIVPVEWVKEQSNKPR